MSFITEDNTENPPNVQPQLQTQPKKHVHPKYGEYEPGWKAVFGFPVYHVNEHGQVRGRGGKILQTDCNRVRLYNEEGSKTNLIIPHTILATFFPQVMPLRSVEYIDGNRNNNNIDNLQWLANDKKKDRDLQKSSSGALSKVVWMLDGKNGNRVKQYASATEAAKDIGIPQWHLSRSAKSGGTQRAGEHYFEYEEEPDLEDEVWTTSKVLDRILGQSDTPAQSKIMVSNKGRIRSARGKKKKGCFEAGNKYRYTTCNGKKYADHKLIYTGFHNRICPAKGKKNGKGEYIYVLHDENAPLDEDGCYRNYAEDLRIGTRQNNTATTQAPVTKRRKLDTTL